MKAIQVSDVLGIANVERGLLKERIIKDIEKQEPVYRDMVLKEHLYSVNMDDDADLYKIKPLTAQLLRQLREHDNNIAYFRLIN